VGPYAREMVLHSLFKIKSGDFSKRKPYTVVINSPPLGGERAAIEWGRKLKYDTLDLLLSTFKEGNAHRSVWRLSVLAPHLKDAPCCDLRAAF